MAVINYKLHDEYAIKIIWAKMDCEEAEQNIFYSDEDYQQ
jgi:hypothetical protein